MLTKSNLMDYFSGVKLPALPAAHTVRRNLTSFEYMPQLMIREIKIKRERDKPRREWML